MANYADDNTSYSNVKYVLPLLEDVETKGKIFPMIYLKDNSIKSQVVLKMKNSSSKKLIGVLIDNKLTVDYHVFKLSEIGNRKLLALK